MNKKVTAIMSIIITLIIILMTIGYANYNALLEFGGTVAIEPDGIIEISRIETISSNNIIESDVPIINGSIIDFNITFNGETGEYYIIYELDISNHSSYPYTYDEFAFLQQVEASGDGTGQLKLEVSEINNGDIINSKDKKTIRLKLSLISTDYSQTYTCSSSIDLDGVQHQKGSLLSSLTLNSNDLTNNKKGNFTLNILNSYTANINFTLNSTNNNFKLVDSDGNDITQLTANANSENNYTIYIKQKTFKEYDTVPQNTTIVLQTVSIGNFIIQTIDLNVDPIGTNIDTTPPKITSVSVSKTNKNYGIKVTWNGSDDTGIANYVILLYDSKNNLITQTTVSGTTKTTTLYATKKGTYYAVVYGIDTLENSGESELSNCSKNSTVCRKSSNVKITK